MDDWDHWRSFLAVMEEGSLSGAARRLGLTQPTLGRHIAALEEAVGAALFLRAPQGLLPTDLARSLLPRRGRWPPPRGRCGGVPPRRGRRMRAGCGAASEMVGLHVLPGLLAPFAAAHPAIGIDLALSNRNEDLLRMEADLAVRMVRPTQDALVARPLGVVRLGLYAAESYVARRGLPDSISAWPITR